LRSRLLAKGFPEAIVDEVVSGLVRDGLQSDARFAETYVRSRAGKGYGLARIRQELKQRGIGRDDEPDLGEWDWDELIVQTYAKKYGDSVPESLEDRAARERFLIRRGFGRDQIRRLFRRLRQGGDD
jgi:regulatory protein